MIKNRVLLTGLVVALLASAIPLIIGALDLTALGLDFSWLADGDITLPELVAFVGAILIAVSQPVRENTMSFMGSEEQ